MNKKISNFIYILLTIITIIFLFIFSSCSNPVSNTQTSSAGSNSNNNSGNNSGNGNNGGATPLKVEKPVFSLEGGSFDEYITLEITCSTNGSQIWYTLDGSNPEPQSSNLYTTPIFIDKTTTIKAIATKENYQNSDIVEAIYTINKVPLPKFDVNSGVYNNDIKVRIFCDLNDVEIFYTLDGTDPEPYVSDKYNGEQILVNTSLKIKAIAIKDGYINSNISEVSYDLKVSNPEVSLQPGIYYEDKTLTISCQTSKANIWYTTDGTDPKTSPSRILYNNSQININSCMNFRIYAEKTGYIDSNELNVSYTLQCLPPYIDLESGTYFNNQTITLNCPTPGVILYYTLDGSNPIPGSSPQYNSPINIPGSTPSSNGNYKLRVLAVKAGYENSIVSSANYLLKVAKPTFNKNPGKYFEETSVSISTITVGASILYSTNLSDPYINYNAPINLSIPTNLKVKAKKTGYADSDLTQGFYNILFNKIYTNNSSNDIEHLSLVSDFRKFLHVSYYRGGSAKDLYYVNNNPSWKSASPILTTGDVGNYSSIAIDSSDYVHIVFYDATNKNLNYITNRSGSWINSQIDTNGDVGLYCVIKYDYSNDYIHVAYYDSTNGYLKYAKKHVENEEWQIETVDTNGDFNSYISLDLDQNGFPHISYYDAITVSLKYAYFDGTEWIKETIDSTGNVGKYSSIAIDNNNKVYITYYQYKSKSTGALKLATNKNGSWQISYIENIQGFNDGLFNKLVIDSNNNLHIIYCRYFNSTNSYILKYAIINNEGNIEIFTTSNNNLNSAINFSKLNNKIYILGIIGNMLYIYEQN
ncbi:MAG: chitobiase/beta-hexosaminidase C-terminal domain-containing protein [Spirochaetes bacterium]|nr:chitobiase/beta-hexosaminidase C-terminal domain-containing protein [Spirochaetota bacterium]